MSLDFNPKISIIIPVFNGSNFLREAINSALAQVYRNLEIIVVNDGSTDNSATEQIALSYGSKIRYFSKINGGTATALNLGISQMTGDYFSWLSHDDLYSPNKISRQVEELSRLDNYKTIIMSDLDGINENHQIIYKTNYQEHINQYPPREKSFIHPIIYNQTHGCTLLIPKICFDEVGLFDEKQIVAQDFEFFYRAFLKFPHKLVPEILVTARESSNRQGKSKKELCNIEYSNLYIKMIEQLSEVEIKQLASDQLNFYYDMQNFFSSCGYTIALAYINKKIIKNLQISSYDLVGNKFNGHDLHLYLRHEGYETTQLVLFKQSKDVNTIKFDFLQKNSSKELLQRSFYLESNIVHLHLVHNIFDFNYLPILCRLKPTVITLHDPFFLGGHCVHHFDCEKWKSHCQDCPYLKELFALPNDYSSLNFELLKQAIQNSKISAIVASKWMENKVNQSPIWNGKKIYYLPFGINQDIFKPGDTTVVRKNLGLPEKSIILFFRAEPGSFKGLDLIKETLSSLENNNIILITVGEKGLLKEFASKFRIIEYGWINNDTQLSKIYQACDIFFMPSRQETFGMMAIEAMSCGKMVLAIEGEGTALPETINSPECGLAVKDIELTDVLKRLINQPQEIVNRGIKSFEYARFNYSKDKYIKNLILIYNDIMANHQIDNSAKIILDQLKKYTNDVPTSKLSGTTCPENTSVAFRIIFYLKIAFIKIYRKMPVKLQSFFEPPLRKFYGYFLRHFWKK